VGFLAQFNTNFLRNTLHLALIAADAWTVICRCMLYAKYCCYLQQVGMAYFKNNKIKEKFSPAQHVHWDYRDAEQVTIEPGGYAVQITLTFLLLRNNK